MQTANNIAVDLPIVDTIGTVLIKDMVHRFIAVLYLYCTILYCTVLYYTILYYTVLYCTVLYCTVLYCTVLYCTVLYCTLGKFSDHDILSEGVSLFVYKVVLTSFKASPCLFSRAFLNSVKNCSLCCFLTIRVNRNN